MKVFLSITWISELGTKERVKHHLDTFWRFISCAFLFLLLSFFHKFLSLFKTFFHFLKLEWVEFATRRKLASVTRDILFGCSHLWYKDRQTRREKIKKLKMEPCLSSKTSIIATWQGQVLHSVHFDWIYLTRYQWRKVKLCESTLCH